MAGIFAGLAVPTDVGLHLWRHFPRFGWEQWRRQPLEKLHSTLIPPLVCMGNPHTIIRQILRERIRNGRIGPLTLSLCDLYVFGSDPVEQILCADLEGDNEGWQDLASDGVQPHVTIGKGDPQVLTRVAAALVDYHGPRWTVDHVTIWESTPDHRYHTLERVPLRGTE